MMTDPAPKSGWALVRTNGVLPEGLYDLDTSSDGYHLTPIKGDPDQNVWDFLDRGPHLDSSAQKPSPDEIDWEVKSLIIRLALFLWMALFGIWPLADPGHNASLMGGLDISLHIIGGYLFVLNIRRLSRAFD